MGAKPTTSSATTSSACPRERPVVGRPVVNVVDTSAVVAVLFGEPGGGEIERKLVSSPCAMSAATLVPLRIVIEAKTGPAGTQLLDELRTRVGMRIETADAALADEAVVCWRPFGVGRHPAGLIYGDTYTYA